jgi:plastocyanin
MRFNRRFAALFVIAVAVAVPIAGCGGGDDDNSTSAETAGATQASTTGGGQTVDMTAADFKFDPSDPTVKSGDVTFKLTNDGQNPHSLEIEDVNGQDQEIEGDVSPGQSGTMTVNLQPGSTSSIARSPTGDGHGGRDHRQLT